jgi:hypothetical protein
VTDRERAAVGGDVLVAGDDEPPWSLGRRRSRQLGAAVLALALVAGAVETVSRQRTADREALAQAAAADELSIALGDGSLLPRDGPRRRGIYVELINSGPRDVLVTAIELGPDPEWGLLPGESGVLSAQGSVLLQLLAPCAEDDPVGEGVGRAPVPDPMAEPPRTLELTAELDSGRTARTELDLVDGPLADGGALDPLLRGVLPDLSTAGRSTGEVTVPCA